MAQSTKAIGSIMQLTVKAHTHRKMEAITRVTFATTCSLVPGVSRIQMEASIQGSGRMTCSTGTAQKHGHTMLLLKESTSVDESMVMGSTRGRRDLCTMGNGWIINRLDSA